MPRKIKEYRTRKQMKAPPVVGGVDPQLEKAGWYLRDYFSYCENGEISMQEFYSNIIQKNYNDGRRSLLPAMQSVFLQKRHLETADLYEPPLDMFGADAVERLINEKEVKEIVDFTNRMAIQ